MEQTKKRHTAPLIIFALICLCNPNVNLFDLLPDFIGYFILAKVFCRAADAVPYFEEARSSFIKLAYVNLAKLLGIFAIGLVRSKNTADYDIYALLSLGFAILEIIFAIPAVTNIFKALNYLGQRSSAKSLIEQKGVISSDSLCTLSYVFVSLKCILYVLPELLRMTGNLDGEDTLIHLYYPGAVVISLIFGFIVGIIWLVRMIKYVNRVHNEGLFHSATEDIASANSMETFERKVYIRSLKTTFMLFILASVFSIDLSFSTFNDINLLPEFIFGIFFSFGLLMLCKNTNAEKKSLITTISLCSAFIVISVITYIFEINFLDNYGYNGLVKANAKEAKNAFLLYEISAVAEMIILLSLCVIFFLLMKKFTEKEFGKDKSLTIKTGILTALSSLCGIVHFFDIFQNGRVKLVASTNIEQITSQKPQPLLPWFGIIVTASAVIYALYSIYYFNLLKEEISE